MAEAVNNDNHGAFSPSAPSSSLSSPKYREALITAAVTGEIDVDTFDNDRNVEEVAA